MTRPFSIVPLEVLADDRITFRDLRVLIALLSFRGPNTNTVWPTRRTLSERCGLPETRISTVTSRLVDLGWLTKTGNGGHSRATRYEVTVPPHLLRHDVTVSDPVTVTEMVTVTESVTGGVTESVTGGVTKTVTGKEETNEQTKRNRPSEDSDESLSTASADRLPSCPHRLIIDLYLEILPELPGIIVSRWNGSQGAQWLKTRWREDERHRNLGFWRRFFGAVRTNPHWMGENGSGWQADLRWLLKRENFDKVIQRMIRVREAA